jgi:hypothetical protein
MYDNSMKTNLDSDKYVRHTRGPSDNKGQGYEACPVVLLLSCCAGESPLGILLALVNCAGLGLGLVFVMGLWASVCRGPSGWCLFWAFVSQVHTIERHNCVLAKVKIYV